MSNDSEFSLKGVKPKKRDEYPYARLLVRRETQDLLREIAIAQRRSIITVVSELVAKAHAEEMARPS